MGSVPEIELRLSLTNSYPPTAYPHRLRTAGVVFMTLADAGDGLPAREKLYGLVREGVLDTPGFVGRFETFEEFDERIFVSSYWSQARTQFLAAVGDEWVGLSSLTLRDSRQGEFGLTVVRRRWRGRGIAHALKLRAIEYARGSGVETLVTRIHPDNIPILALNRSLGFRPK